MSDLPPRPATAPAGCPIPAVVPPGTPSPVRRKLRPQVGLAIGADNETVEVPTSVVALATPSRLGKRMTPLGVDTDQADGPSAGVLATPKNSERHGADGHARLMMPRSAHSIRQNVLLHARPADEGSDAHEVAPQAPPSAPGAKARSGIAVNVLADEITGDPSSGQAGVLATPRNSERGCTRVMMPRSTHSIRNKVIGARGTEETDIVPDLLGQAANPVRRNQVGPLGEGAVRSSASCLDSGPWLKGSTQMMPLWQGNGVQPPSPQAPAPAVADAGPAYASGGDVQLATASSSTQGHSGHSGYLQPATPATAPTLAQRRGTPRMPLREDVDATRSCWASGPFATPKNGDRRDTTGSMQLNAPMWRGSAEGSKVPGGV